MVVPGSPRTDESPALADLAVARRAPGHHHRCGYGRGGHRVGPPAPVGAPHRDAHRPRAGQARVAAQLGRAGPLRRGTCLAAPRGGRVLVAGPGGRRADLHLRPVRRSARSPGRRDARGLPAGAPQPRPRGGTGCWSRLPRPDRWASTWRRWPAPPLPASTTWRSTRGSERWLAQVGPAEAATGRARVWVRKESVLKATGDGLARDPRLVVVSPPFDRPRVLAWPEERSAVGGTAHRPRRGTRVRRLPHPARRASGPRPGAQR